MFIVTAKQCCTEPRQLSEGPKELERNRVGIVDLKWPKGYPIPQDIRVEGILKGSGSSSPSFLLLRV